MFDLKSVALGAVIVIIVVAIICFLPVNYETMEVETQTETKEVLVTKEVTFSNPLIGKVVEFNYKLPYNYELDSDRFGDDIEIWISNEEDYNDGTFDLIIDYSYFSQGQIKENSLETSVFVPYDTTEYRSYSVSNLNVSKQEFLNWEDIHVIPPKKRVTVEKTVETAEDLEDTVRFLENVEYEVEKVGKQSKSGIFLDVLRGKGKFTGFGF